jgi:hypothetical protein
VAEIRWHPRAKYVLDLLDYREAARVERAVDRLERFTLCGTPIESGGVGLRRALAGGGRVAWSIFYQYAAERDELTVIALGPPGVPVVPLAG